MPFACIITYQEHQLALYFWQEKLAVNIGLYSASWQNENGWYFFSDLMESFHKSQKARHWEYGQSKGYQTKKSFHLLRLSDLFVKLHHYDKVFPVLNSTERRANLPAEMRQQRWSHTFWFWHSGSPMIAVQTLANPHQSKLLIFFTYIEAQSNNILSAHYSHKGHKLFTNQQPSLVIRKICLCPPRTM